MPDFSSPKNVKVLREWDGDLNSVRRIKMIHLNDPKHLAKMAAAVAAATGPQKSSESSDMQE